MRLAISNIAWRPDERDAVYRLMSEFGFRGLEIAPALIFPAEADPFMPAASSVSALRAEVARAGIELVSMQSILYGVHDAKLFGSSEQRDRFEKGLVRALQLASMLEIPNLVLGAPANRVIPDSMKRSDAESTAIEVFRRLGDLCVKYGSRLALEPNASAYGTNFLNTTAETINFVGRVDHAGIRLNFDIGALHMNDEFAEGVRFIAEAGALACHVHISEPHLAPAPANAPALAELMRDMSRIGYCGWYSIEMRGVGEQNLANVASALARTAEALAVVQSPLLGV